MKSGRALKAALQRIRRDWIVACNVFCRLGAEFCPIAWMTLQEFRRGAVHGPNIHVSFGVGGANIAREHRYDLKSAIVIAVQNRKRR